MGIDDCRENRSSERRTYFMRVSEIPPAPNFQHVSSVWDKMWNN